MKELKVSQDTLFFSLKYALGRKSGALSAVARDVILNIGTIDDKYLKRMVQELSRDSIPEEVLALSASLKKDLQHEQLLREAPWNNKSKM